MAFVTAWRRATVYAVVDRDGARHWRYSLRPHIDAAYWRERGARRIIPLEPPAPAMWAEYRVPHGPPGGSAARRTARPAAESHEA